jgi:mono/diheme cytochrome c family protein
MRVLKIAALGFCAFFTAPMPVARGEEPASNAITDPFLGDPAAIAEGRRLYRTWCYGCHHSAGARGPDLFATKLSDEQFIEVVINGRKGTQMPAFGYRLTPDEVWQVHSYIKSTDHYE